MIAISDPSLALSANRQIETQVEARPAKSVAANQWSRAVWDQLVEGSKLASQSAAAVGSLLQVEGEDAQLRNELYQTAANAKILTAHVSMHLSAVWRKRIFEQLDYLLSADNWDDDAVNLNIASFGSFLQTIAHYRDLSPPFLSIGNDGNLWATWRSAGVELSVEFKTNGRVRVLFVQTVEGEREAIAWDGPTSRLRGRLENFDQLNWFRDADRRG